MRLAGCEELTGIEQNRPFAEAGAYDVMMPYVKYAGGVGEMMRCAAFFEGLGVAYSPHNPGGPICNLAAMHLAAAIPNFLILEEMETERALRDDVCTQPVRYAAGRFELPTGPGLGTDLNLGVLAAHRFQPQPFSGSRESLWR